jgi:short-subunit dehydrogenase
VKTQSVVLITGASSGIGEALALRYAQSGCRLVLAARRLDELERVKKLCEGAGASCHILQMDMAAHDLIPSKAIEAIACFGRIDFLINNAGISQRGKVSETSTEVDKQLMDVNYFGTIFLTKYILPELIKNQGKIIVISSLSGLFGFPQRSAYAASKFALHGFFETLQLEEKNIHITIVCPGRIKTNISFSALTADGTPHGKMDEGQLNGIDVNVCAAKIQRASERHKKLIVIAKEEKILLFFKKWIPSLFYRIASKIKAT